MLGPRTRRSARPVRSSLAAALAAVVLASSALAATPSLTITTVGGQAVSGGTVKDPLSGMVTVAGTSMSGISGPTAARPLVADAGDSPFVASGSTAVLLGAGFGGTDPYAFSWSTTAGTLEGADSATALVDRLVEDVGRDPVEQSFVGRAGPDDLGFHAVQLRACAPRLNRATFKVERRVTMQGMRKGRGT